MHWGPAESSPGTMFKVDTALLTLRKDKGNEWKLNMLQTVMGLESQDCSTEQCQRLTTGHQRWMRKLVFCVNPAGSLLMLDWF